jgi:hypothetical protein
MPRPKLPQEPPAPTPAAELRVRERIPCDVAACCQSVAARGGRDLSWPGKVRDVSAAGIGLILSRRFEPSTCLVIDLPTPGPRPPDTLLALVLYCTPLPHRQWLLGCAFATELSEDELQRLLRLMLPAPARPRIDRLTAHSTDGAKRSAKNRPAPLKRIVLAEVTLESADVAGEGATLTVRRLNVTGEWPPRPGDTLTLGGGALGVGPAEIRLRVESCTQRESRWTVRYTFADVPSPEALQRLGHSAEGS